MLLGGAVPLVRFSRSRSVAVWFNGRNAVDSCMLPLLILPLLLRNSYNLSVYSFSVFHLPGLWYLIVIARSRSSLSLVSSRPTDRDGLAAARRLMGRVSVSAGSDKEQV